MYNVLDYSSVVRACFYVRLLTGMILKRSQPSVAFFKSHCRRSKRIIWAINPGWCLLGTNSASLVASSKQVSCFQAPIMSWASGRPCKPSFFSFSCLFIIFCYKLVSRQPGQGRIRRYPRWYVALLVRLVRCRHCCQPIYERITACVSSLSSLTSLASETPATCNKMLTLLQFSALQSGSKNDGGTLSYLPGQRLSRCTCAGQSHPGPMHTDGTFVGRSTPEIDVLEAQVTTAITGVLSGQLSQSAQWAPMNAE